jgi:serine/threonine protein phosphatase PrpC
MNARPEPFRLRAYGRSDSGCVRETNEDAFYVSEEQGLFIVSDGMGGERAGSLASAMIVQALPLQVLSEHLRNANLLDVSQAAVAEGLIRAIGFANDLLLDKTRDHPEVKGLGATVVAGLYAGSGVLALAHLGDSRSYLMRGGYLERLTSDHTVAEMLLQTGHIGRRQLRLHPSRHVLTRHVGKVDCPPADAIQLSLEPGDRILLCTDGLTGMLDDRTIGTILWETEEREAACRLLIDRAKEAGGRDNITAITVDVGEPQPLHRRRGVVVRRAVGRPLVMPQPNPK